VPSFIFVNSPLIMLLPLLFFTYLLLLLTQRENVKRKKQGEMKNEFTRRK
jgi:hypothetical protein